MCISIKYLYLTDGIPNPFFGGEVWRFCGTTEYRKSCMSSVAVTKIEMCASHSLNKPSVRAGTHLFQFTTSLEEIIQGKILAKLIYNLSTPFEFITEFIVTPSVALI